ncbi:phosphate ABC transporter permease subunit PstC [Piscirickettsia litoralis]|uniref:Phosphate transport system permease protein n=2 Tax=Piscirickettsia litoralis TaxID=1891921 RepID=A0ABX3A755_9GAMM|nr:phosphate ABC transporter permease subunit PstC [Piscirickettsia litoralis]
MITNTKAGSSNTLRGDRFYLLTKAAGLFVIVALIGILISLIVQSWPALEKFGLSFIWANVWNPAADNFGGLSALSGTLITSVIAMIIAVPASFAIAVFMTELTPRRFKRPLKILIDMMAGIPSIIYGMWGLFIFVPFMSNEIQPWLTEHIGTLPLIGTFFSGPPLGIGVLTAGIILSFMIIPMMSSMLADILETVPVPMREASHSLGVTRAAVVCKVLFPYVRSGVIGTYMLGLGRALGETMAVTFVIGNSHSISNMLFMPGTTISASIANEFNEATGHLYPGALMELALILFALTFCVILFSRLLLARYRRH